MYGVIKSRRFQFLFVRAHRTGFYLSMPSFDCPSHNSFTSTVCSRYHILNEMFVIYPTLSRISTRPLDSMSDLNIIATRATVRRVEDVWSGSFGVMESWLDDQCCFVARIMLRR
jgi:hypothetical protein